MPPPQLSTNEFRRLAEWVTEVATGSLTSLDSRRTISATLARDTGTHPIAWGQPADNGPFNRDRDTHQKTGNVVLIVREESTAAPL